MVVVEEEEEEGFAICHRASAHTARKKGGKTEERGRK